MAAAHDGYRLVIERFPMGEPLGQLDGRPIASVRFIRGGSTPDSLFAQVTERRTSKRPFESRPVTSAVLNQLCSVSGTTSWLRASNEVALVGAIRGIALQAFAIEQHTPRIKLEQVRITRFGEDEIEACPDGIDLQGDTVETALTEGKLSRLKLADPNSPASKNAEKHYLALCNTAAAYVWLSTGGNTRHDQLDAVSYTHLDVYKRQLMGSAVTLRAILGREPRNLHTFFEEMNAGRVGQVESGGTYVLAR